MKFVQIAGGGRAFCGLTAAGTIYSWGIFSTSFGIPYGTCPVDYDCAPTPAIANPAGPAFSRIFATEARLCGLSDGKTYCWGAFVVGSLGTGEPVTNPNQPHTVLGQECTPQPDPAERCAIVDRIVISHTPRGDCGV